MKHEFLSNETRVHGRSKSSCTESNWRPAVATNRTGLFIRPFHVCEIRLVRTCLCGEGAVEGEAPPRHALRRSLQDVQKFQLGTWYSGITPAQHAGGPGLNPQCVHSIPFCLISLPTVSFWLALREVMLRIHTFTAASDQPPANTKHMQFTDALRCDSRR